MRLGEARTPDGMRLYAIGDVHGCDELLAGAHARIAADLASRPIADYRIIHVGDYIDRGPNSAAVIGRLARLRASDPRVVCLRGNHDEMLLAFLADPEAAWPMWLANGALATFASYGVAAGPRASARDIREIAGDFDGVLPASHRKFMESLGYGARFSDFFFCHAGIRPGVPLDSQAAEDLIWIREPFLLSGQDHGVVVIHGHTPAAQPEVRPNRINIDTGAVYGGHLTCLALEGLGYRFL
jgi:serine/threonine protein phosphatase 1